MNPAQVGAPPEYIPYSCLFQHVLHTSFVLVSRITHPPPAAHLLPLTHKPPASAHYVTAGMDATAKRQMWDLINRVSAQRSVVLTTHSMEVSPRVSGMCLSVCQVVCPPVCLASFPFCTNIHSSRPLSHIIFHCQPPLTCIIIIMYALTSYMPCLSGV